MDLARAPEGAWILTERTLLRSDGTTVRPARHPLPAGARPRRLVADGEEVWLATSRGLVRGGREAWRPVGPVGVPLAAIALGAESVWAAGPRGVFKVAGIDHPANAADASMAPIAARPGAWQPPIAEVHRAVVRAHGLEPSRGDRWRRRVAARGRLPEVELRVGYGGQRDRGADTDEAFTSGALRRLHDNDYSRGRDFNVAAVLRWDLGETVYHPEEVDVAKEVREWIELRDEILDEVHQLYYERLRVLAEREALAGEDPQRGHLTIRAAELSAGLDAWTVGWWARALRAGPPAPSAPLSPQPGSVEKRP